MTPYQIHSTFHRYRYLVPGKIPLAEGAVEDFKVRKSINKNPETAQTLNNVVLFSPKEAKKHADFVKTYFQNLNHRQSRDHWLSKVPAPHHIWFGRSGKDLPVYSMQEPVREVRIRFLEEYVQMRESIPLSDTIVQKYDQTNGAGFACVELDKSAAKHIEARHQRHAARPTAVAEQDQNLSILGVDDQCE